MGMEGGELEVAPGPAGHGTAPARPGVTA
jgi:hypothetical protein